MDRLKALVASSIGKKGLMALTGLGLIGFLVIHLAGNLTIFAGSGAFNGYADTLHSLGPITLALELGLLAVGLVHIALATVVVIENWSARPQRYAIKRGEGGQSLGSRTMLVTGPYIGLFLVFHLLHFTFSGDPEPISAVVAARFQQPPWIAFYAFSMAVVGLHVSHGLWSGFQTLGMETSRDGGLRSLGLLVGTLFVIGFASIPIAVYAIQGLLQ